MIRIGLILLVCIFTLPVFSQKTYTTTSKKAIKLYEDGASAYGYKYFYEAERNLNEAIQVDNGFMEAYMVLAEVYWEQKKYREAIDIYSRSLAKDPEFYPKAFLNKGQLELKIGDYQNALKSYEFYLTQQNQTPKGSEQASRGIELAKFGVEAMAHPVAFNPLSLGESINTQDDEYWPSLLADGNTLVLTRRLGSHRNPQTAQEDFFESTKQDTSWSVAKNMGAPLNTPFNEGAQSISADGKTLVYTVCDQQGVIGRCDLYISYKEGDVWTKPKNMGRPVNTEAKETQPSLSADGRVVYFSSDRAGGFGKMDLWMSEKSDDGLWQQPLNLGDSINSPGNEISPFIHFDNQTLYFSSDWHLGLGGHDIFYSRKNNKMFPHKALNIGYPINTPRDEFGLIVDAKGTTAYYASGVREGYGQDIYRFALYEQARPVPVTYVKGKVFDSESLSRLEARFELSDLNTGNLINQSVSDKSSGEFLLCLPTNKNYLLNVSRSGYLFYSGNFSLEGIHNIDTPFKLEIPLEKIKVGGKIILRNVFYETDSYTLKPESELELNKVVHLLRLNPEISIQIEGHTDNVGTVNYNQTLSEKRAQSVVKYIEAQGISPTRLIAKGFGLAAPIGTNESPEGRAINRRTELKIIK